jgi:RNA polymerase sigma-70 factor (ECF subfamily)
MNEQQAIDRARNNDIDAFNQLVLAYQNLAYSVAYRMLQDEAAAADAVQDSFIKAYRGLNKFKDGNFKSWLMRIVVNTCYDVLRVRGRRPVDSLDDMLVEPVFMTPMSAVPESPELHAERTELRQHLETCIEYLPEDQRLAVILCDIHGYAYDEIADVTGWPMGTVKSRISRARIKLQEYLQRQSELLPLAFRPKES